MSFDLRSTGHDAEEAQHPFLEDVGPIEDPARTSPDEKRAVLHPYRTGKILAHWESEGQDSPLLESKKFIAGIVSVLIVIIAYSIATDSPIMAIQFILIGMTSYMLFSRPAEPTEYMVTEKGIFVGRSFYEYPSITSFWIIEGHPQFPKHIILDIAGAITPRLHIPLEGNDAEVMRRVLSRYVPEEEYEPNLIDIFERILHI
ncbi:MAG TPA: hypothetical protein VN420_02920 [Candidatus Fimivivens sp.]|nr:hypothetical protein [Candidatus Fimivivens sp.]